MSAIPQAASVLVPYHLDEYLPDLDVPVRPGRTVTAELPPGDTWQRMAALYEHVAAAVASEAATGRAVLVQSGDCTTSLGVVAGLQRAGVAPSVVWFDAHGDVQTLETSTSGYLGGMPLRMLAGYRPDLIGRSLGLEPVDEERIVLVDARDLDPPERAYLDASAIGRSTVDELDAASVPDGPIYLHLDLDVVDAQELPGLLFPVPSGATIDEVAVAVTRVIGTGRVVAIGIGCTWHPGHDAAARVRAEMEQVFG